MELIYSFGISYLAINKIDDGAITYILLAVC